MRCVKLALSLTASVVCFSSQGLAQDAAKAVSPPYTFAVVVETGPSAADMQKWEAAQKDYVAACKEKKCSQPRRVWQTVQGKYGEYRIIQPLANFSQLDEPQVPMEGEERAAWIARVSSALKSRRTSILQNYGDLSIPTKPGRNAPLGELIILQVSPGKNQEFIDFRKSTMMPAYKKAGANGVYVAQTRYGESRSEWSVFRARDSWEEIEKDPMMMGLDEQAAGQMQAKLGAMTESVQWLVMRYRPDLSYVPE